MERFKPTDQGKKPFVLNATIARSIATVLQERVITMEEMDKVEHLGSLLPEDNSKTSIKNAIKGIKDTIHTLAKAPMVLVVPLQNEREETIYKFVPSEKVQGEEPQVEEELTIEEESNRVEGALSQGIGNNFSSILSAAEVIIRSPYSTELESTDAAEDIKRTIERHGGDSMKNRFSEFTRR